MARLTGLAYESTVRAQATLTLAYPKSGLLAAGVGEYVGDLYLGDIGVPTQALAGPGLGFDPVPLFFRGEIISLAPARRVVAADIDISVRALLGATAQAHHRAFETTGGADADWAEWYGRLACSALEGLFGDVVGSERLGRMLAEAEEARGGHDPQATWEEFYTEFLVQQLGLSRQQ